MDLIRKRAWIGWAAGIVVIGAIFVWASMARPSVEGASAAAISRGGLLTLVMILPILLAGRAISKFTADNTIAAVLLPVVLAGALGALMVMFGWVAENQRLCTAFERYDLAGPECYTPLSARLTQLAEAYGLWVVFGVVLFGFFQLRARKRLKAAQA